MIHVFHFLLDHRVGGPHIYAKTINQLLKDQIKFTIATTNRGDETQLELINLRHTFRYLYPLEVALNTFYLVWIFHKGQIRKHAIFDVHGVANLAPLLAARLLRIPIVWHYHETLIELRWLAQIGQTLIAKTPHKEIAVANETVKIYRLTGATVIPGAVDVDFWQLSTHQRRLREGSCQSILRLITVGNMNPLKGLDLLLDAIKDWGKKCSLTVVGSELATYPKYSAEIYKKAAELTQGGSIVNFVGWQPTERVRTILAENDIFVMPSRSEACPIALLEAMAMECTCIANDVGDVHSILHDGEAGVIVGNGPIQTLKDALEFVASAPMSKRLALGATARSKIIEDYSSVVCAKSHLDIYESLTECYPSIK